MATKNYFQSQQKRARPRPHIPITCARKELFFITIMILLPYKIFCYLTSEAFKNQLTLKTPEATSSASIKERKHFRIRNQERKLSPANILNEPAQTSRFRPQRPVRRSFPCLFTHPIKLEESSRARSRLFYTLPETNPRLRPCSPNRAEDAQLLDPPACPPARPPAADGAAGAQGGARSPPRPPRSLPPFPIRRLLPAGGPGGPRALTGLAGSGSRTGARGLSTTARPPRPARRHLGSQARPRAASSRCKGVARADGGPANRKRRQRPPASRLPPNPGCVSGC